MPTYIIEELVDNLLRFFAIRVGGGFLVIGYEVVAIDLVAYGGLGRAVASSVGKYALRI